MAILEVQNLEKKFGSVRVLKDISFTMEKGSVLTVLGSSGSGKTTLLRCLNFLERPDSGRIYVDGRLLLDAAENDLMTESAIRQNRLHFGMVFQNFNLFPQYTALKNVTLAPLLAAKERPNYRARRREIQEEIEVEALSLLEKVGLSGKRDNYPHQLSGGQQQRVAIARALAMKPDILCFDEPTSALDPELTGEVLRAILALKEAGSTMIIVTHEMDFAERASDRIIFMADGVIAEEGTPQQIFGSPQNDLTRSFIGRSGAE